MITREDAIKERDEARKAERDLSDAYLRLRALIPGAYDTPHAPSREQVWETTEAALRQLIRERDEARAEATKFRDLAFEREEMIGRLSQERDE